MKTRHMMTCALSLGIWFSTSSLSAQNYQDVSTTTNLNQSGNKDGGLAWADFNNDGCLDVLINTNDTTQRSRLFESDCTTNPTFTDKTSALAPGLLAGTLERAAVWGDFNEDGHPDFVRNTNDTIEIYINKGPTPPQTDTINAPYAFGDTDGLPNTVYTSWTTNTIFSTEGIGVLDYDLDGHLDLIIDNNDGGIVLLKGSGTGTFMEVPYINSLLPSTNSGAGDYSAVGDYDVDGDIDFFGRKGGSDIFVNDAANTTHANGPQFTAHPFEQTEDTTNKGAITLCDVDNDGDFDFFWTENGTNQLWIHNKAQNTFSALSPTSSGITVPANAVIDGAACGDVDNDGDMDLFLSGNGNDHLFINNGNMTFTKNNHNITGSGNGEGVAFADYDNDGDLDLLINQSGNNQLWRNRINNDSYVLINPVFINPNNSKRPAYGATVIIKDSNNQILGVRELSGGFGHGASGTGRVHIGLPNANGPFNFEINFPGAGKGALCNIVPANIAGHNLIEADASLPDTCPVCGDGAVGGAETCDDGNTNNGDGCDSVCAVENNFTCPNMGGECLTVALANPVDNAMVMTDPDYSGTTTAGNTTVKIIVLNDNGTPVVNKDAIVVNGSWTLAPQGLQDGIYRVQAIVSTSGGDTVDEHTFTLDDTPPAITISNPPEDSVTADTRPPIDGTTDSGNLVTITIKDDQNNTIQTTTATPDANGHWGIIANQLNNGLYTVEVSTQDDAGNIGTNGPNNFRVDTTAFAFAFINPIDGSATRDDTPRFSGTGAPGDSIEVTIKQNNTIIQTRTTSVGVNGQWQVDATTLVDGTYEATAEATDPNGTKTSEGPNTFTINTAAPLLVITSPTQDDVTSDKTPTITGTTSATNVVSVVIRDQLGNVVQTMDVMPDAQGNWSFDTITLFDGKYDITARTQDNAGNQATDGPNRLTVDTAPPSVALISPQDGTQTNDNTPSVSGTSNQDARVNVTIRDINGVIVQTKQTNNRNGTWQLNADILNDGEYTVTVISQDNAGNESMDGPHTFTVDTNAPLLNIVEPMDNAVLMDNTPELVGTTNSPNVVRLTIKDPSNNVVQTPQVNPNNGQWRIDAQTLNDGTYTLSAQTTDNASNTSTAGPITFSINTEAPALNISTPTNGSIINDETPSISGTAQPGIVVNLTILDNQGATQQDLAITSDANGIWQIDANRLMDGNYTVSAEATDNVGNTATDGPVAFTINTGANTLTINTPTNLSTTNDTTPQISGESEANAVVNVILRDDQGNTIETLDITADAAGLWQDDAATLQEGTYTITATEGTLQAGPNTFTVDTTAQALTIDTPADGSTTNDITPIISGTGEADSAIALTIKDSNGDEVETINTRTNNASQYTTTTSNALVEGIYTIEATATDRAGNISSAGPNTFTVDATAPQLNIIAPADDSITNSNTPTLRGTAEPGALVTLQIRNANNVIVQNNATSTDANGDWTTNATQLPDGPYNITATAIDIAGNIALDGPNDFIIDTIAPTVVLIQPGDQSIINDDTPTISGTAEVESTLVVTIEDIQGNLVDTLQPIVNANGQWQQEAAQLQPGTYTATVIATDEAGNTSNDGPNLFVLDTAAPFITITSPIDASTIANPRPNIDGETEAAADVFVILFDDNNTIVHTAFVRANPASGNWQVNNLTADLSNGVYTIEATATDEAGNTATTTSTFTVDLAARPLDIVSPAPGTSTTNTQPDVVGTTAPNELVSLTLNDTNGQLDATTVTADGNGDWSYTPNMMLVDGRYNVIASVTNQSGAQTTASTNFTVDTVSPTLTITTPMDQSISNDTQRLITGTTDAGITVTLNIKNDQNNNVATLNTTGNFLGNYIQRSTSLTDGIYTLEASAADDAGNTTTAGPVTFIIDTIAPPVSIIAPTQNAIVPTRDLSVTGTTDATQEVTIILFDDNDLVIGVSTQNADLNGGWVAMFTNLSNGRYRANATVVDAAGNVADDNVVFSIDSDEARITIQNPVNNSTLSNKQPNISGITSVDADVVVTILDDAAQTVQSFTPMINRLSGTWAIMVPTPLSGGKFSIEAVATRPNGKIASDTVNFTIDTEAPTLTLDTPADGSTITDTTPRTSGVSTAGQLVAVVIKTDNGDIKFEGAATTDATGNWSLEVTPELPAGQYTAEAATTDDAGNRATAGPNTFTVEPASALVIITSPSNGDIIASATPTIVGTSPANSVVDVRIDDDLVGNTTANAQGEWTFELTQALATGQHTVQAQTQMTMLSSETVTFTVVDPLLTITTPGDGDILTTSSFDVTGTASPNEEITVTIGDELQKGTVDDNGNWKTSFENIPEGRTTITAMRGDEMVSIQVTIQLDDPSRYVLEGNGCSSTGGKPTRLLWIVFGALLLGWRRRRQS